MTNDRPPWQDPETLRRLYYGEGLTQRELAERFDVTHGTIGYWMRKHDLAPGPLGAGELPRRLLAHAHRS